MRQQASVAVLCTDVATSDSVALNLTSVTPTTITLIQGGQDSKSSDVTSTIYLAANPSAFENLDLGAHLAWGANAVLLVVNSTHGIDAATIRAAKTAMLNHPLLIAITDLDSEQSSFDESLAVCQRVFGEDRRVAAISLPVLNDRELVQGSLNLATESITWQTSDHSCEEHDLDPEHYELVGNRIDELLDSLTITSLNESFVQAALSGEGVESSDIHDQIIDACQRLEFIPVLALEGDVGLRNISEFATELGLTKTDSWTPVKHQWVTGPIATVLPNDMIRLWQGTLTVSDYLIDGADGQITCLKTVGGTSMTCVTDSNIFIATLNPVAKPGATISTNQIHISVPDASD